MKTENIYISKDCFLDTVLNRIVTNTLLFKNITGIGATYLELMDLTRDSIIVVPNVPVIQGKKTKHPNLLGVHEGIGKEQIKKYLKKKQIKKKKIMTTPESFSRVIDSLKELEIDYLKEYFLLIDEFDKMIHDSDYREKITYPMSTFFHFKNKAMVSATPLIPTDPRFKEAKFTITNIVPRHTIMRDLKVTMTNSVLDAFKSKLENCKTNKIFVFFKSLSQISNYIKSLDIENNSTIFTSKDEVEEFYNKRQNIAPANLCYSLDEKKFSKYNFLTSRYFTALDIDITEDVDIIILADINRVSHSIIDPSSDIIQIVGRFRNSTIQSYNFITEINPKTHYKTQEQCLAFLNANQEIITYLESMRLSTSNPIIKEVIDNLIKENGNEMFVNDDYSPNYFLRDNYCLSNEIKSFYTNYEALISKLKDLTIYNTKVKYFNIIEDSLIFSNLDLERVKFRNTSIPFLQRLNTIIEELNKLSEYQKKLHEGEYIIGNMDEVRNYLLEKHPAIFNIFMDEGETALRKIATSQYKLDKYYRSKHLNETSEDFPLIQDLQRNFNIGEQYHQAAALNKFYSLASKYDASIKRSLFALNLFVETKEISKLNGQRRLEVIGFRHSL